jgi:anti-sigma regulatory factor (Ser/Thr protein kinase)
VSPRYREKPARTMVRPATDFAFVVNGGREAGQAARRAVLEGDGAFDASLREDLLLLVTELVTNAVRHAGVGPEQSLRVELRQRPGCVRVDVVDPGTSFTRAGPRVKRSGSGGWGLFLVERMAERWGVRRRADGTCVWFELRSEA